MARSFRNFLAIFTVPSGPGLFFAAPDKEGTAGPPVSRKKVLIVEDNETNLKLLNDLLEFQGHQILTTAHGVDALTITRESHPDLILLDLQLPDVSGFEVARQLKADEATRPIPIIAVTAFAMQGDRERALASGCDLYISKPINVPDFLRTIHTLLGSSS